MSKLARPSTKATVVDEGERIDPSKPVIAMITIMEPRHYPIQEDEFSSRSYGQIIDDMLAERPNATSITLDLDRSKF